jgi:hypothetical protein
MPNQDSVAHQVMGGPVGAVVAAVADGHGHARHFRSAVGSALAVDVACRAASRLATVLSGCRPDDEVAAAVRDDLAQAIVLDWRAAVARRLEAEPYTAQEQSALDLAGDGPEVPYGTTLLLAIITARWLVCAQIGDGDLLAILPDSRSFYPLPGDSRLDGQRTTSLCQADAVASFRTSVHDLDARPVLAVLLATDGYGNAQAAEAWQPGVAADLARFAADHDHAWFGHQVPAWAERCASADGSGDDTTIALLLQPGAAGPAAVNAGYLAPAASPGKVGWYRRRAAVIAAVIAVAILALVLALVLAIVFARRPAGRVNQPPTVHNTQASQPRPPSPVAPAHVHDVIGNAQRKRSG